MENNRAWTCLNEPIRELLRIRDKMLHTENRFREQIATLPATHRDGARNLLHYLALRRYDLRPLQETLAAFGLSSLGRCESRVLANLNAVLKVAGHLAERQFLDSDAADFISGKSDLDQHTAALLGPKPANREVRIMVTMPSEAATDYRLVSDLVAGGMDCMRINCAHDDEDSWANMIEHLHRAQAEHGKTCRVIMDLPGPKLRTGAIEPLPGIVKWKPKRDRSGKVTAPARVRLTPMEHREPVIEHLDASIPVPLHWLSQLRLGDRITFVDARGASRSMDVIQKVGASCIAQSSQTSYVHSATTLNLRRLSNVTRIGALPSVESVLVLKPGDFLILTGANDCGSPARCGNHGEILEPARIAVSLPQIITDARAGEPIWFDDGKIGGIIRSVDADEMRVEIIQARAKGDKLHADKGINLPESELNLPALTAEDIAHLPFIARHADLVGYSFVRSPGDVELLLNALDRVHGNHLGIVLKIETRKGFERLPSLILTAMRCPSIGVMIARGDLAVECGYERTGELQEEIMWIAEAAHVPVIWATQVLETLAKKGHPSRSEITDAAMGERAECVMLNKGPFVTDAVRMLDNVLRRMQDHQAKKSALLRPLNLAKKFCHEKEIECPYNENEADRAAAAGFTSA